MPRVANKSQARLPINHVGRLLECAANFNRDKSRCLPTLFLCVPSGLANNIILFQFVGDGWLPSRLDDSHSTGSTTPQKRNLLILYLSRDVAVGFAAENNRWPVTVRHTACDWDIYMPQSHAAFYPA